MCTHTNTRKGKRPHASPSAPSRDANRTLTVGLTATLKAGARFGSIAVTPNLYLSSRMRLFLRWERCSSRPAWCETVAMAAEYIPAKRAGGC